MSTILNALKKVEKERAPAATAEQQRQLNALQPDRSVKGTGSRRKWMPYGIAGVVVILLSLTTYWLFGSSDKTVPSAASDKTIASAKQSPPKAAPKTPKRRKPAASRQPASKQPPPSISENRTAPGKNDRSTPGWPSRVRPSRNATDPRIPPTPSPLAPSSPGPEETFRSQRQASAPTPGQDAAPKPQPETRPAEPSPAAQPSTDSTTYGHLDRLTDGSLKVQAIAWSPVAEERMAVINSKIIREGSSVDDYTIIAIGEDEVVVRKSGRMQRVIFGRP